MEMLSKRVAGSEAGVADAGNEGIQKGLYSRLYSVDEGLHEEKKDLSSGLQGRYIYTNRVEEKGLVWPRI